MMFVMFALCLLFSVPAYAEHAGPVHETNHSQGIFLLKHANQALGMTLPNWALEMVAFRRRHPELRVVSVGYGSCASPSNRQGVCSAVIITEPK